MSVQLPSSAENVGPAASGPFWRWIRLARKELREILRDRRTIVTLVIMPLLLYPLLSMLFQQFILANQSATQAVEYVVGFPSKRESAFFLRFLALADSVKPTTPTPTPAPRNPLRLPLKHKGREERLGEILFGEDLDTMVKDGRVHVGVRLAVSSLSSRPDRDGPAVDWQLVYREGSVAGQQAVGYLQRRLEQANRAYLQSRLQAAGIRLRVMPVRTQTVELEDPQATTGIPIATVVPLILILMTITGAVYPAIDLTAGERERGTLEVLMAAPLPRMSLLLAKYIAVLTVAMLTAMVNLAMMMLTLQVSGMGALLLGETGLSPRMVVAVFAAMLLFAAFFSAVLLALTSFARSFKEAQAYLIPLTLASIAPGFLSLMPGTELRGLLTLVPLMNIVLLVRDLFQGQLIAASTLAVVSSTAVYALLAILLAARVFGGESVLYSTEHNWRDLFRRTGRPGSVPTARSGMLSLALIYPIFYYVNSGIAHSGWPLAVKLPMAAVALTLLFAGIPMTAAWLRRVPMIEAFSWRRAGPVSFAAAVLLGVSLWALCHEIVLFEKEIGLTSLDDALLEKVKELVAQFRDLPVALVLGCLAAVPAVCEELFFRGYLFNALRAEGSALKAIVGSAVLFGLFHVVGAETLTIVRFVPSALLGVVLAWMRLRTGSIFPGMLLHACHNGLLISVIYYQPAIESWGIAIGDAEHLPPVWLAAALVLAAVGGLLLQLKRQDHGPAGPDTEKAASGHPSAATRD